MQDIIDRYRDNAAALRRYAAAEAPTRNHAARDRAIDYRERQLRDVEAILIDAGPVGRALIGALVAEKILLVRLAHARRLGQTRPELRARLTGVRRQIAAAA